MGMAQDYTFWPPPLARPPLARPPLVRPSSPQRWRRTGVAPGMVPRPGGKLHPGGERVVGHERGCPPDDAMTTAVTTPAPPGARVPHTGRGLFGFRFALLSWRGRLATSAVVALVIVALGSLLVVTDLQARTAMGTTEVSLQATDHQLSGLERELSGAEKRLATARSADAAVTRFFD